MEACYSPPRDTFQLTGIDRNGLVDLARERCPLFRGPEFSQARTTIARPIRSTAADALAPKSPDCSRSHQWQAGIVDRRHRLARHHRFPGTPCSFWTLRSSE